MPTVTPYGLGMRGTGDWASGQRPKTPREGLLYLYPNGSVTLTAMLSMMRNARAKDPEFSWWTKALPTQGGTVANVYTDAILSSAYTAGVNAVSTSLFVKVAEAVAQEFRAGHTAMLRDTSSTVDDVGVRVIGVTLNGASSFLSVKTLEATATASADPSTSDRIVIIGNTNAEGANIPDAVSYDPVKLYNYTQIFRTPYEITRTAQLTKIYAGDPITEEKREKFELHTIEMEKAFIWGRRLEWTGSNGKPERSTWGMVPMIQEEASSNVFNYQTETDSAWAGYSWLVGGEDWLDNRLEVLFRYGPNVKMAFCGSGALLGIQSLVKASGQFQISTATAKYGIAVVEWLTPFGTLLLKHHPLFSYEVTNRNAMVVFPPENIKEMYISQTMAKKDTRQEEAGFVAYDARKEEWLTETGLQFEFPSSFGYLNGVGLDNSQ